MVKNELFRRYILFAFALFVSSFGVSCITRATLGTSPISSVPYVLSLHTPFTMGTYTFLLNMVLIVIQFLLLGKECTKKQAAEIMLQVPASILFGLFIDITMSLLSVFTPANLYSSLIELVLGCFVLALGVALQVTADVVMLSGELTVKIASHKFKKEFGLMKVIFDVSLVVAACIISMTIYYFATNSFKIDGVGLGTIMGAVLVGPMVRFIIPGMKVVEKMIIVKNRQNRY
ncbi:MAG: DUF6198 family protein [Bacteroidales bacterium]|nr:DUF6198 family protein [Bacteroidales bacterium]